MKTFIMLVPKTGYAIEPEDIQETIKFVGVMNINAEDMEEEAPIVVYNGILTNDQKKLLEDYLRSLNNDEKNIVPIFIECNELPNSDSVTLTFKPNKK